MKDPMNTPNESEQTALALATDSAPIMQSPGSTALILDPAHFKNMMAVAEVMATGIATVPAHLRKNKGDCLAVVMQAAQWGMNPFAVAQKTHLVGGTLGYEAQLVNAVVNTMAPTKDRINYEWYGDWSKIIGKVKEVVSKKKVDEDTGEAKRVRIPDWRVEDEAGLGVKVWATMKGEKDPRVLELLLAQARTRNSPLWADDPRQQLAYLAVKRWTRLHCPDVLLGVYTRDELEDAPTGKFMGQAEVIEPQIPAELLNAARTAADKGRIAFNDYWKNLLLPERNLLKGEVDDLKARTIVADKNRTVENPAPAAPTGNVFDPPDMKTLAGVLAAMDAAKNREALDIAADWCRELADEGDRKAAEAHYSELSKKFGG